MKKKKVVKPKKKFSRPTTALKYKMVLKNYTENQGKMGKAITDAGYSKFTAENPKAITSTKTWQELLEEVFPDDLITKKHNQLLNAREVKTIEFPNKTDEKEAVAMCIENGYQPIRSGMVWGKLVVYCFVPDTLTQDKALDKLYKITNRYSETVTVKQDKYRKMKDSEIAQIIAEGKKFFRKQ